MRRRIFLLCSIFALLPGEAQTFKKVSFRCPRGKKDNRLTSKDVHLIVDEAAGKLALKYVYEPDAKPVEVKLADITKMTFEATPHGRDVFPLGGVIGMAVASKTVSDYWCFFKHNTPEGERPALLEIDKGSSQKVIDVMRRLLGERVSEPASRVGGDFDKKTLAELDAKYTVTFPKLHPIPEKRPDSALIVAVFPTGSMAATALHKLHANDKVILANVSGTYSFAYLPPGEYLFASQCGTANGMKLKVDAGSAYYFVQSARASLKSMHEGALLSQNSEDLVLYEVAAARYVELQAGRAKGGRAGKH